MNVKQMQVNELARKNSSQASWEEHVVFTVCAQCLEL